MLNLAKFNFENIHSNTFIVKRAILISILILTITGFLLPQKVYAQIPFLKNKIKLEILSSELNQADTTISIKYSLKAARNRYYSTKLFYSNNNGNSFKGPLRSVIGDLGDSIKPSSNKSIAWSFRKDNPYFDGQNISFKIEVLEVPKEATGGPENALRSLLVPGLGDGKVRNGYNYSWISVLTYSLLGTGTIFYFDSEKKYKDHQDLVANTEQEHRNIYENAKNSQNLSRGFLIAGVSVWAADVIGVYFKGLKNKRRIQRAKEEAEAEKEDSAFLIQKPTKKLGLPQFIPNTDGQVSQLSLLWKF